MYRACELKDQTYKKTRTLHFSEFPSPLKQRKRCDLKVRITIASDCDLFLRIPSKNLALSAEFGGGNWVRPRPRRPPPGTVLGSGNVYGLYFGQLCLFVWFGVCFSVLVCLFGNLSCGHVGFGRTG